MESKTFNELLKATKSDNADTISKAFARAVTISKLDLNTSREYEFPELVQLLIDKAQATFKPGSKDYRTFMNHYRLITWIEDNRDFAKCQQASFQRDIMVLKAYAERFCIAEMVLNETPENKEFSIAYSYSLEAYMNEMPTEPFVESQFFNDGQTTNDRLEYGYSWVVAYNTVIKTAARVHELPELELELLDIDSDIQMLKEVMQTFDKVKNLINASAEEEAIKFSKIVSLENFTSFTDKYGNVLRPSEEAITDITAKIKDFSLFKEGYKVFADMFPVIKESIEGDFING